MQLRLNIYKNKKIEKTYEADTYDMMFGTVEDVIGLLDEVTLDLKSDADYTKLIGVITGALGTLKPLLKDVFEGLTDDELRCTKVKEIVPIFVEIIKYSFSEIKGISEGKN